MSGVAKARPGGRAPWVRNGAESASRPRLCGENIGGTDVESQRNGWQEPGSASRTLRDYAEPSVMRSRVRRQVGSEPRRAMNRGFEGNERAWPESRSIHANSSPTAPPSVARQQKFGGRRRLRGPTDDDHAAPVDNHRAGGGWRLRRECHNKPFFAVTQQELPVVAAAEDLRRVVAACSAPSGGIRNGHG